MLQTFISLRKNKSMTSNLKILADTPCLVYVDSIYTGTAKEGVVYKIPMRKGKYLLEFRNCKFLKDVIYMEYTMYEVDIEDLIHINLLPIIEKRLAQEAELIKIKKEKEILFQERIAKYIEVGDFIDGLALVKLAKMQYGYINTEGEEVIPCKYRWAQPFSEGLACVSFDQSVTSIGESNCGYINSKGEIILSGYNDVSPFSNGIARVGYYGNEPLLDTDPTWMLIDRSGTILLKKTCIDLTISHFEDGYAIIKIKERWWNDTCYQYGLINEQGHVIKDFIYDLIERHPNGLMDIKWGDHQGQINYRGDLRVKNGDDDIYIPAKYTWGNNYQNGTAPIYMSTAGYNYYFVRTGYINLKGELLVKNGDETIPISSQYFWAEDFTEGLACVAKIVHYKKDNTIIKALRWGYIDISGKEVIPCQYETASDFKYNNAEANGNIIDKSGQIIFSINNKTLQLPPIYTKAEKLTDDLILVQKEENFGVMNNYFKIIIPCIYTYIKLFGEYISTLDDSDSYNLYDKNGKLITQKAYKQIEKFEDGLAVVCMNGLPPYNAGFIDETGNEVIPVQYDQAKPFSEGLAAVKKGDKWGYINKIGEIIIPFKYDQAFSFTKGVAQVLCDGIGKKINHIGDIEDPV